VTDRVCAGADDGEVARAGVSDVGLDTFISRRGLGGQACRGQQPADNQKCEPRRTRSRPTGTRIHESGRQEPRPKREHPCSPRWWCGGRAASTPGSAVPEAAMPMMVRNMGLSMTFVFDARQGAPLGRRMAGFSSTAARRADRCAAAATGPTLGADCAPQPHTACDCTSRHIAGARRPRCRTAYVPTPTGRRWLRQGPLQPSRSRCAACKSASSPNGVARGRPRTPTDGQQRVRGAADRHALDGRPSLGAFGAWCAAQMDIGALRRISSE
jgi:hypothetical protein